MSFYSDQKTKQIEWWKKSTNQPDWEKIKSNWGYQNKVSYPHIVKGDWKKLLWRGIREELPTYLGTDIKAHSGVHNLLSSWVTCANLYFPAHCSTEFKGLLLGFLQTKVSNEIVNIIDVELEYSLEGELCPKELLGEMEGGRGTGQTSPDVAFIVKTVKGIGLILTECKYTEHSFYRCSARRTTDRGDKPKNPNPEKCLQVASTCDYSAIPCHQIVWGRKYLNYFQLSEIGKKRFTRCPAATSGYQLMRQQALANGIYKSGKYDLVVSSVSFDSRNNTLIGCLKNSGINDFQTGWAETYSDGANFTTWYHQEWVNYVKSHNNNNHLINDWLIYMKDRYQY